jgi:hypothetical protein
LKYIARTKEVTAAAHVQAAHVPSIPEDMEMLRRLEAAMVTIGAGGGAGTGYARSKPVFKPGDFLQEYEV